MKIFLLNRMKAFKGMSIKRRFVISVLFMVIIIMSIFGVVRIKTANQNIEKELKNKIEQTIELAAHVFKDPVWNYNNEGIKLTSDAFLQDKEVGLIILSSDKGEEVYKKQNSGLPYSKENMIISQRVLLDVDNKSFGIVTIGITRYYRQINLQNEIKTIVQEITIMVLILWTLITITWNMVTKPIYELKKETKEIAQGNLTKRLEIYSRDEIGQLAEEFNLMTENLCSMIRQRDESAASLAKVNVELETKNQFLIEEMDNHNKAQAALAISEEKFNKAFRYSADVIGIIREKDLCYIEINDAFSHVFGYSRDEVIEHPSDAFGLWCYEEERIKTNEWIKTEGFFHNFEIAWRTKGGEIRVGLCSAELIEIGRQSCILFVWHDITGRKQGEEELRQAHAQLETRVEERTQELYALNQELTSMYEELQNSSEGLESEIEERKRTEAQLEKKNQELERTYSELKNIQLQIIQQEKMASIGQLAAGVAHEINNPLGFIISNVDTLGTHSRKLVDYLKIYESSVNSLVSVDMKENYSEKVDLIRTHLEEVKDLFKIDYIIEDIADLIDETLEGADRVKNIVQNLKGFSRAATEAQITDINLGIESVIRIIWNEIKYKITLKKELGDIPLTKCNQGQLNQVFMNLLLNATQAIDTQGEIKIKTWAEKEDIFISISDTGCGIPPETINRIFEPFFTTKEVGKGTGLGLGISYDIVKKHNGSIDVSSILGKGSTFTVRVPIINQ